MNIRATSQENNFSAVDNGQISTRGKSVLNQGEVALVGSGPGDAELLTIRAMRFIEQAEIAIYDRLVSDEILDLFRKITKTSKSCLNSYAV